MELRQLEYLVAVADDASFTRAAERLHVSQPAISAQLKKLERELGEPLLDRTGSRVRTTPVGEAVLAHARRALGAVEAARAEVDRHAGLLTGRATIGVIGSGLPADLPDLLASFAREHPAVEVTLTQGPAGDRLAAVLDGRSDVAIVGLLDDPPSGVDTLTLSDDPVLAVVASDHRLAGRTSVRLADLADEVLVALPQGTGLRAGIDAALDRLAVRPRIGYEAATPVMLAELAARGLGVALVPASVLPYVEGVVGVPLRPALRAKVELAWPTERPLGPAGRALRDHLRAGLAPA